MHIATRKLIHLPSKKISCRHFHSLVVRNAISDFVIQSRCFSSGIDKVAENKIAEWLQQQGDKDLPSGKKLSNDYHKVLAASWGVGADYIHGKILADNNIKPESVQRRLDMDDAWTMLKERIRVQYQKSNLSPDEFVNSNAIREEFETEIIKLDKMVKRVNDAIIDDSMRFNGRSPVRHARRFRFEERIREAIVENQEKCN
jgi:hypothetical protein